MDYQETATDNRARLHTWLAKDIRFARITVVRNGDNLKVWWPPLSAEERATALRTAYAHVARWQDLHPEEPALQEPASFHGDEPAEKTPPPVAIVAEAPPGKRRRRRTRTGKSLSEAAVAAEAEYAQTSGIGRRFLIVMLVLAAISSSAVAGYIAYKVYGVPAADIGVIAILSISALIAAARGFVREMLSLIGWPGAAIAAYFAFPYVQPRIQDWIGHELAAKLIAPVAVFCIVLSLWLWISDRIERCIHRSVFNSGDRLLGLLFGLARGGLVVCLIYLGISIVRPPPNQPAWIAAAHSKRYAEQGVQYLMLGGEWLLERMPEESSGVR